MPFFDRSDAGRRLAARLTHLQDEDVVVLGLPRGGVPVAAQVARALRAPLDVIVVRKLGVPVQPELGMGAIGEGDVRIINPEVVRIVRVSQDEIAAVEARERAELERRARRFRGDRPRTPLTGRTAIIIDDGIATGSTARAACQVARAQGAGRVVLAVPVAPPSTCADLAADADEVICLETPEHFLAIGEWYRDFSQTSDDEVIGLLRQAAQEERERGPAGVPHTGPAPSSWDGEVAISAGPVRLPGHLSTSGTSPGVVLFAHGSGSSRHSPRNRFVADVLADAGLGTLLFDLLTPQEEQDRANVFDIGLLAGRLSDATRWLRDQPGLAGARIGYFGASTGAAAALWAAAEPGSEIAAVVSRGGRPDLAIPRLATVRAPTLLIVGGRDEAVLEMNREAQRHLHCENDLAVVPGATHLFSEPGTLERAAGLARDWFTRYFAPAHARV
ncbi:MAG TPA: phosphoribosyl transferase [Actinobacteria bacterium]|nr:phosphoribosyl transferase [Actinomycetota bacterium]